MRLLYGLATGKVKVLVASMEALSLRTVPRQTLFGGLVTLKCGAEYDLDSLTARLVRAGYSRTSLVEGVGQFALRGGILDVFSPAHDQPIRAEFFGDELDAMGFLTRSPSAGRRISMRPCFFRSPRPFRFSIPTVRRDSARTFPRSLRARSAAKRRTRRSFPRLRATSTSCKAACR